MIALPGRMRPEKLEDILESQDAVAVLFDAGHVEVCQGQLLGHVVEDWSHDAVLKLEQGNGVEVFVIKRLHAHVVTQENGFEPEYVPLNLLF